MRNCETCGADISHTRKGQRFCDKTCSSAAKKRDRICEYCGRHFWPKSSARGKNAQKLCGSECRGNARKKIRTCAWCGEEFTRTHNGQPKFCKFECFEQARRKGRNIQTYTCYNCGKEFERYSSTVRNPDRVYCDSKCYNPNREYKRGEEHPQYKGGGYEYRGYIYETDYTQRAIDNDYKYKAQHIRVMEEELDRPLAENEYVHHINMVKSDNRIENLIVLNQQEHRALHHFYEVQFCKEHEAAGDLRETTLKFLNDYRQLKELIV